MVADQIALNVSVKDKEIDNHSGESFKSGQFLINKEDLIDSIKSDNKDQIVEPLRLIDPEPAIDSERRNSSISFLSS